MVKLLAVLGAIISAFFSCLLRPSRLEQRAWRSDFTMRVIRQLLLRAQTQSHQWARDCQRLLTPWSLDLLRVRKSTLEVAGVPCVLYCPKRQHSPAAKPALEVVYFHGGGYVIGSAQAYRVTLAKLAHKTGLPVLGVDYRLAPEYRVPAAQHDALAVVRERAEGKRLILAGDSAGAGLAVATARSMQLGLHGREAKANPIAGCVLLSPWVAPFRPDTLCLAHEAHDFLLQCVLVRWAEAMKPEQSKHEAYVDFSQADLSGMPATLIQTGGSETLGLQIAAFAKRLEACGVAVEQRVFPHQFHVFQTFAPLVKEADGALQEVAAFIHRQAEISGARLD